LPTEFSPIFREFLEIPLDLEESVFIGFLFTAELRYIYNDKITISQFDLPRIFFKFRNVKYIVLLLIMIVLGQRRIKEVEQYQKIINEEAEKQ
jgi:hypothetical protein